MRRRVLEATDPGLPAIVDRLRQGEASLLAESRALGYSHNALLRRALRELLGREEYDALMVNNAQRRASRPSTPHGGASC